MNHLYYGDNLHVLRNNIPADSVGLFLSLEQPTAAMVKDAAAAGFYESPNGKKYPRLHLLTIEGLLTGTARPEHPDYEADLNFKKAKAEKAEEQEELAIQLAYAL
jgi:hypothetical protein